MLFVADVKEILRASLSLGAQHVNLVVKDLNKRSYKLGGITPKMAST